MKGIGLIVFGALAVITGIGIAVMLIRKRRCDNLVDFDDFDTAVNDEEFEHFFGAGGEAEDEEES